MSFQENLQLVLTIAVSFVIVALVISLGWFLIWKTFLSKFRLVREILGQTNDDSSGVTNHIQNKEKIPKVRKIRKE